jgi:hypothetical protein
MIDEITFYVLLIIYLVLLSIKVSNLQKRIVDLEETTIGLLGKVRLSEEVSWMGKPANRESGIYEPENN